MVKIIIKGYLQIHELFENVEEMDNFLEKYKLATMKHEQTLTTEQIFKVTKDLLSTEKRSHSQIFFIVEFFLTFQEQKTSVSKVFTLETHLTWGKMKNQEEIMRKIKRKT